ncbi:MAG: NHLP family bacteriocin export ABC transporter peptidase/permease/ATPase subunit [Planctomycetes bacterium]|nr:NHLP family bacteriocin export ABC transporter peptidase/permease/ATPase subunit [Planctomycetota bacterium]
MSEEATSDKGKRVRPPRRRRVHTPTVIQMEAVECGAAALAMVLAYHGRYVPLEQLRLDCGVSRDGSKASNMVKAAQNYGFEAKGWRKDPDDLKLIDLPVIVFWNFNHFVVVEGFDREQWYLNDPATGPRSVPKDEFDESFTGVVLTFDPSPEFKKGGERPRLSRSLHRRTRGAATPLTYAVIAGLALVIPGLVIPTFSKIFVDQYLINKMSYWVRPLLLGMGVTAVLFALLTWLQQYCLCRLEIKLALAFSGKFLYHVMRLPIEFFAQRYGGDIASRVLLNDKVAQLLSGQLAANLLNCLMVVFYAILMYQYDRIMTLVGVAIAMTNLLALQFVSRRRRDLNKRMLQNQAKLIGTAMNGVQMMETLKATGGEDDFFSRWAGYKAKAINAEQGLGFYTQILNVVPPLLTAFNTSCMLGLGGLRVMQGALSVGELVAFQSLMLTFSLPINQLVMLGSQLQEAEGDMNRIDDVLNYEQDPELEQSERAEEGSDTFTKLTGRLEMKGVSFGYSRLEAPLIEDFNLTLAPGSRVALVGSSGSGKSTISKLICGLFGPWSGQILFDGKPRAETPRRALTSSLGLVDQDILLFEGTIRQNLSLWDPSIPEEDILQAARDACIHEDIAARAAGYDSKVDEGGLNFSGGQRQRLEIARALAMSPSILVLDEATSALDPLTEKRIDDALRRRGCTCVIVAHRLSTIRDCDEIIVLERGKVVQRGTHDELVKAGGAYYDLIKDQ